MIQVYRNFLGNQIDDYIQELDNLLQQCAQQAYNLPALDLTNAKLKNWYDTAVSWLQNPGSAFSPPAKYGYAVEELFNLSAGQIPCPAEYQCLLQAGRGMTIPDIVLQKQGKDIAWLDITSQLSIGHIYNKAGSRWHTMSYVAELLYPKLDFSMLRTSQNDSIAGRAWMQSRIRAAEMLKRKLHQYMCRCTDHAISLLREADILTPGTIADTFNHCFCNVFGWVKHPAIHSILLEYMDGDGMYKADAEWLLDNFYKHEHRKLSLAHQYIIQSYQKDLSIHEYLTEDEIEQLLEE